MAQTVTVKLTGTGTHEGRNVWPTPHSFVVSCRDVKTNDIDVGTSYAQIIAEPNTVRGLLVVNRDDTNDAHVRLTIKALVFASFTVAPGKFMFVPFEKMKSDIQTSETEPVSVEARSSSGTVRLGVTVLSR